MVLIELCCDVDVTSYTYVQKSGRSGGVCAGSLGHPAHRSVGPARGTPGSLHTPHPSPLTPVRTSRGPWGSNVTPHSGNPVGEPLQALHAAQQGGRYQEVYAAGKEWGKQWDAGNAFL